MVNLSNIGRIFYGTSIAVMGFLTIWYRNFPYMLLPPHKGLPGLAVLAYISGAFLVLCGASIVFGKKARPVSLALGVVLLLIFCFYFIPYELLVSPNYMHYYDWENAAKELALAGGAFVIAGCFPATNENRQVSFSSTLVTIGEILFSLTIISFSMDHFLYAKDAADYVPSWVPFHLFWIYFCGIALLGSGVAIILKIRPGLAAALLGLMIFIWFVILHMPRVIVSPVAYIGSEITSAFLALAYSGIAFALAGNSKKKQ
jgi:uncharacterized membrane protein YphA (DoxX/SURF4 family)